MEKKNAIEATRTAAAPDETPALGEARAHASAGSQRTLLELRSRAQHNL